MQELPVFVAGVVVGLVLAAATWWLRSHSVTTLGSGTTISAATHPAGSETSLEMADEFGRDGAGVDGGHRFEIGHDGSKVHVVGSVHRLEAKLDAGGGLQIVSDGRSYAHLAHVPEANREQVIGLLRMAAAQSGNEQIRQAALTELRAADQAGDTDGATRPRA